MIKNPQLFQVHMDGLSQILRQRGGGDTLDCIPLQIAIFGIEVNGRLLQDAVPINRPPYHVLCTRSKLTFAIADVGRLETSQVVAYICQQLKRLNEIITAEASVRDLWRDVLFPLFHISPILHDCLSIARGSLHDDIETRHQECFRLAAILYLCNLRAKFDFEPGAGMLYGSKLYIMAESIPERSNVLLWALAVGACSVTLFDDLRSQFVTLLSGAVRSAGIATSREFLSIIEEFIWCGVAFGPDLSDLQDRLGLGMK